MAKRFSIEAVFKAVDKITAPVTRMQSNIGKFVRDSSRGVKKFDRQLTGVTRTLKSMGIAAAIAFTIISAGMLDVIKTGAKFEQTLVNASARFGIKRTSKDFKDLENAAREMGRTTEFTASQSAEALNFLALAGFDAKSAIAALPGVIDLATAASTDLGTASDIATDSLGAFGLLTKDPVQLAKNLGLVNDILAKTSTSANVSIQEMFETIKDGAPIATITGQSIQTFAALVGFLGNAGIKGSKGATALKNIFTRLAAPKGEAEKVLKSLGVLTKDARGNMRDVVDIIEDLKGALDGLGTADRSAVIERIFGLRAIAGAGVLIKANSGAIRAYRDELLQADGTAKKMAATMRDTLTGRFKAFQSAIEDIKLGIFKEAEVPLNKLVVSMTKFVRGDGRKFIKILGSIMNFLFSSPKLFLAATVAIVALTTALVALVIAVKAVNLALALLSLNPIVLTIGLIVAGVILLIALMASIVFWFEEWTEWLRNSSDAFKVIVLVIAAIAGPFALLIAAVALLVAHWELLQQVAEDVFVDMFVFIDKWLNKTKDVFTDVWDAIATYFKDLWAGMKQVVQDVMDFVMDVFHELKIFALEAELAITFDKSKVTELKRQIAVLSGDGGGGGSTGSGGAFAAGFDVFGSLVGGAIAGTQAFTQAPVTNSNKSEITIRDETGKAEITGEKIPGLKLQRSGDFD